MRPFVPSTHGYVGDLDPNEMEVLAGLADDVAVMVRAEVMTAQGVGWTPEGWLEAVEPSRPTADPAVRRLLPVASADEAVADEFRRLASADIAERKVVALRTFARLVRSGPHVVVPRADADAVASALTDMRLVLADRLHLTTDAEVESLYDEMVAAPTERPERGNADARRHLVAVFLLAGLLQESLVEGMLTDLRTGRTE